MLLSVCTAIYVVSNKLAQLSTKDYNAEGTASMGIKTLCEILGFTKSKLTNILKHFLYDGGRLRGKIIPFLRVEVLTNRGRQEEVDLIRVQPNKQKNP